jgi:hypothetical protein
MNRYIKVPLLMGGPYALMQMIFALLDGRPMEEILFRATTGFVSFVLLGLILTFAHSQIVKGMVRIKSEQDFSVHQQRNVTLRLPFDKAFEVCKESLEALNKRIKIVNASDGSIEAITGSTVKTFGCVISYVVKPINERLTEVQVSSMPLVRTTLIDYGENLENVEKICAFLSERDDRLDVNLLSAKLNKLSEAKNNPASELNAPATKPKYNV